MNIYHSSILFYCRQVDVLNAYVLCALGSLLLKYSEGLDFHPVGFGLNGYSRIPLGTSCDPSRKAPVRGLLLQTKNCGRHSNGCHGNDFDRGSLGSSNIHSHIHHAFNV